MTMNKHRFSPLVGLVVAIVGLIGILVVQHLPNRHGMEADLTHRSEQALQAAGLPEVQVTFTGRDGELQAGSPAEAERALNIVRALKGVRTAEAHVPSPMETAAMPVPPSVILALAGGRVSISGRVPTEAAETVLADAAVAVFGAGSVDNRLTVDNAVTDAELSGLPAVLRAFGKDANNTTVELNNGTLILTGTVPSETSKAAVMAAALGAGAVVVDRIRVAEVQQQLMSLPPLRFTVGGVALTPTARASLIKVSDILNTNPSVRIRIEGHTDSSGSAESNLALSRARARTVLDFLARQGITAERMSVRGYGETRPKLTNTSSTNRSVNRRVELIVSNDMPDELRGNNGT